MAQLLQIDPNRPSVFVLVRDVQCLVGQSEQSVVYVMHADSIKRLLHTWVFLPDLQGKNIIIDKYCFGTDIKSINSELKIIRNRSMLTFLNIMIEKLMITRQMAFFLREKNSEQMSWKSSLSNVWMDEIKHAYVNLNASA